MKNNSQEIIKKKKKVIIILLVSIAIIMIIIGFFVGLWAYNLIKDFDSQNGDIDTSYVDESESKEDNNNILNVELNSNNDPSDINNVSQPNKVQNEVNTEQPKPVNIPYYIKINNQANVVTVYKKDSKRKIYSTV